MLAIAFFASCVRLRLKSALHVLKLLVFFQEFSKPHAWYLLSDEHFSVRWKMRHQKPASTGGAGQARLSPQTVRVECLLLSQARLLLAGINLLCCCENRIPCVK